VPPEPPTEQRLACVYGTYPGHGNAQDAYPGWTEDAVMWGPHHGIPIIAPADGRVERYAFGTPLDATSVWEDDTYVINWTALFAEWICRTVDPLQTMLVAVFFPTTPMTIAGQRVGHVHYAHVENTIKTGAVRQGEQFAASSDSGIRFEPGNPVARAAHVHCAAGAGTNLSPNGDLDGRLAIIAQGWAATDIHTVPGPAEYQRPNLWCAGRRYEDFQKAGKAPPPLPG
jgi:hypothetical protein